MPDAFSNSISGLRSIAGDVLSLFFPNLCVTCHSNLVKGEKVICALCELQLPKTDFHVMPDNPLEKYFWGKVEVERVASFLYFHKHSKVQQLIHELKYRDRKDVGLMLGRKYGTLLKQTELFGSCDMIIPVPLHAARKRKRGYNQAECFAEGLGEAMGIPVVKNVLVRNIATETQTKKNRLERWKNVESIFECENPAAVQGKRVLLVDDVITTGATMEACAVALHKAGNLKVNFATIACA